MALGLRVLGTHAALGLGFGVLGLGFRVRALGCRVCGLHSGDQPWSIAQALRAKRSPDDTPKFSKLQHPKQTLNPKP